MASDAVEAAAAAEGEDADGQSLMETIPKLYSSRIYKDFLKGTLAARRIPHYLQRVESPNPAANKAPLSSRRGGIPLLDGESARVEETMRADN